MGVRETLISRWAFGSNNVQTGTYNGRVNANAVTFYLASTQPGTWTLQYVSSQGHTYDLMAPVVAVANQLVRVFFNGNVPQAIVTFTPAAFPGDSTAEVSESM